MQRDWGKRFGLPLVEKIKSQYPNCIIDTLVFKINTYNLIKDRKDLFNKIWLGYKYDDNINEKNFHQDLENISIEDIENTLQIDSVWKNLIHIDRNLVYTPGVKWRYSFRKQVSDKEALNIVKLNFLLVKNEIFGNKKPDIVIFPNVGSIFHNVLYHYAKVNNVECWSAYSARLSNRLMLNNSIDVSFKHIFKDFEKFVPNASSLEFSKNYLENFRKEIIRPAHSDFKNDPYFTSYNQFKRQLIKLIKLPKKTTMTFIRNLNKLNPKVYRTADNIKARHVFLNFFSESYNLLSLKIIKYDDLSQLGKFAFFPLHVQPEISTNLLSPLFTNQFDLVRKIAISLPFGITLVVKEHPLMIGRKKKKYYEKLKSLPNVKLINHNIATNDIIKNKNCDTVTVISGTAGFEAALLGKKVIQFSDTYLKLLPNVRVLTDMSKFTEEYKKIGEFDEKKTLSILAKLYENSFEEHYDRQNITLDPKPYIDLMMKKIKKISLSQN